MELYDPKMKALLTSRIEQRYQQGRLSGVFQIGGAHYTPEQIVDEVRRGTPAGEEFLYAEKKLMDEMKKRM